MFFGLPLRTTKATTEVVTRPLFGPSLPVRVDDAGVDEPRHVGLGRERHDVGLLAGLDRAAWSPEAPKDVLKPTPLPAAVFWKSGMISS